MNYHEILISNKNVQKRIDNGLFIDGNYICNSYNLHVSNVSTDICTCPAHYQFLTSFNIQNGTRV